MSGMYPLRTRSHAREPPGWLISHWAGACGLRNRPTRYWAWCRRPGLVCAREREAHNSGFRRQASVVRAALGRSGPSRRLCLATSLQLSSAGLRGRKCQHSAQADDGCFFTITADRRARAMTRCGAAETSRQRQAYPLSYVLSRSSGGLEPSLPQDDRPSGVVGSSSSDPRRFVGLFPAAQHARVHAKSDLGLLSTPSTCKSNPTTARLSRRSRDALRIRRTLG